MAAKPAAELHIVEDDLVETWVEDFAAAGIRRLEDSLLVHAAFQAEYPEPE